MISMTGYAYREKTGPEISASVEIKGCNSRYLEISVNLPPWLSVLEMKIREQITLACGRGKIDVYVRLKEHNAPVNINVNTTAAKVYYKAISELAVELGINEKPALTALLEMDGVLEVEKNRDEERYWNEVEPLLQEALKIFCDERKREGKHTEEDILRNLEKIESSVKTVTALTPVIENTIKENIRSRFAEVLGSQIDENRMLTETAALLVKCTISEEISRLVSHLGEFRAETEKNVKSGKKLDFLSQEINREVNTIGSKCTIIEASNEVVNMKEALENIREQLRNVE